MTFIEKVWYPTSLTYRLLKWLLLPLTGIFWLLTFVRRSAYAVGLLRTEKIPVPVIIIGNISVGGNGKTPLVVFLANWLKQQGYKPGILSRGYGGKSSFYPTSVEANSDANKVGDEPILIRQRVDCPVVVDPKRPRGARYLVDKHLCDVILCDDGMQHYALKRDIEIAVVDGSRRYGNNCLLPMGPLREPMGRLEQVQFVINNGGPVINNEVLMEFIPENLVNIKHKNKRQPLSDVHQPVVAVAAIGNPQRFFDLLEQHSIELADCLSFIDHYQYQPQDIPDSMVIMTEKDAVKCREFAKEDWWFLPIRAKLPEDFLTALLTKLDSIKKE
ncbi:tetraacyldisaccharide 4'-kinase [Aliiglaciecola sp. LCG003]|uniref:tetraacyldisaccharide 4'-kinase n=1 Tax=Aliiglaciecola sp. LCG003 TaxID=3053655 RepID=UPI00257238C3|nr:tetraacyldisaccharide 4'-kinase [Aliiglaciecola sp. LCG003]WJG10905.1 tetraacyldisaccharide 4'-kinase [Aliiglaciecola sp. LCG003]